MSISPVFLRYLGFQIPGFCFAAIALVLLSRWTSLSETAAWVLFGLWVAKDLALYPWVKVGYESRPGQGGADGLLGARGTALSPLAPDDPGHVRIGPERWRAQLLEDVEGIAEGSPVRVVEVRGLTVVVEAAEPDAPA